MASGSAEQESVVDSVTMLDVLNDEKEMENETAAVLGGSDEKNCTYSQGPVKRQALYSCLTCVPEAKDDCLKSVGVCLACSYACHENHELVELYTKRNFRCDCGTPKMGKKCSLVEKTEDNTTNEYNQNYSGLYCNCHRPYPDPDRPNDDEMIQCIVCEDWYHSLHLDTDSAAAPDFGEMICGPCVARVDFLKDYTGLCVTTVTPAADESNASALNVTGTVPEDNEASSKNEATPTKEETQKEKEESDSPSSSSAPVAKKAKLDLSSPSITPSCSSTTATPTQSTSSAPDETKCKRPKNPGNYEKGGTFWPDNWREQLCKCAECMAMYQKMKVEYLVDNEDTVKWYESVGMKKLEAKESDYDRGMRQLSSLDRVRQIDAITAYNNMKTRLKDYLNQFVASQQVVTEADIKRFFQQMKNEDQKDLMVHSDIPYNCR